MDRLWRGMDNAASTILFLGVDILGIDWHLVPFTLPNLWTPRSYDGQSSLRNIHPSPKKAVAL